MGVEHVCVWGAGGGCLNAARWRLNQQEFLSERGGSDTARSQTGAQTRLCAAPCLTRRIRTSGNRVEAAEPGEELCMAQGEDPHVIDECFHEELQPTGAACSADRQAR